MPKEKVRMSATTQKVIGFRAQDAQNIHFFVNMECQISPRPKFRLKWYKESFAGPRFMSQQIDTKEFTRTNKTFQSFRLSEFQGYEIHCLH